MKRITLNILVFVFASFLFQPSGRAQSEKDGAETREAGEAQINLNQEKTRRVEIPSEALPENITRNIITNYDGSEIIEAWKWVNENGEIESYEVHVMKEALDMRLKYDQKGNPIKLNKE